MPHNVGLSARSKSNAFVTFSATRPLIASKIGFQNSRIQTPWICEAALTNVTTVRTTISRRNDITDAQSTVLTSLGSVKGRGKSGLDDVQKEELAAAVQILEADGGLRDVTVAEKGLLDGRWRLLFTSRPGTASPIQNTFTGVDSFSVFQDVDLSGEQPTISNVVDFGSKIGYLKVQALASTDTRPLEGFTPRQGAGIPLFGKSFTYPAATDNSRVDFQFDNAAFHFKALPFTIPYPVPFRLLGDETKGWLDVTYMSPDGNFRLSRGNKGTLFILVKEERFKSYLESAIRTKDDDKVLSLIQLLALDNPTKAPAKSEKAAGNWRLIWSQQAPNASPLQKFGSQQANSFQLIDGETGTLQNLVLLLGGLLQIRADADCSPTSDIRTSVFIKEAAISLGNVLKIPVKVPKGDNNPGFIDWLYLDEDLRITKGSKGSIFVHKREIDSEEITS
ncbi:hypothetical protein CEUSTIGMA_g5768.t1 [Chlamydomonas eustigma]|uniref:Plastid lipid-associated protein/fibrillin conserved domain-containing protein n=1 Tax=Chlamydomonas eustigma TaxID=1157962 RepID=A0A250X5K9_9CHLO|nr:hypothetical protein CEUSTIGMA_g5768.t1 [Chlamydomonas eustigma]|eukprot:GAX78326.1 hypothetical protein CEUSTIGMA_g5768.t1 [Chlamydomonas eustigma]